MYTLFLEKDAVKDTALLKKSGGAILVRKLSKLLNEIKEHPRSGSGKPERLKYQSEEIWSRRLGKKHRIVYKIREDDKKVILTAILGHYEDK